MIRFEGAAHTPFPYSSLHSNLFILSDDRLTLHLKHNALFREFVLSRVTHPVTFPCPGNILIGVALTIGRKSDSTFGWSKSRSRVTTQLLLLTKIRILGAGWIKTTNPPTFRRTTHKPQLKFSFTLICVLGGSIASFYPAEWTVKVISEL